ncbi:MAG: DEAD/DEAH box helicase-like protein [archaeon GW2011_AR3]|nr:MAG: DEAD/DEAH box helicase-like protein [archaeon GW2011_AR3]MBS3108917.1 DEAD/DEAH box helicase [Candidatus Woesearchaeota archaeon]
MAKAYYGIELNEPGQDDKAADSVVNFNLPPDLAQAVQELGFTEWTDIQRKSIPLVQQGQDVIGQSKTGSGKTAAFGLPLLEKIKHGRGLQALILVPTRELAEQVTTEMKKFSKFRPMNIISVYGGVSINPQIDYLPSADIVVGTPGRILDHTDRRTIDYSKISMLVLDEADKMFEMGFVEDVDVIISHIPKNRQTLLFSATMSSDVLRIVDKYMKKPVSVKVQSYVEQGKLVQHYYDVDQRDKFSLLVHLLKSETQDLTMIFCATRRMVDVLHRNLERQGISSEALHGGLTQAQRKVSIDKFHKKEANILVASDVAARGLDIKNVSHIYNYDLPKTSKEYIHRIGRTARAGSQGKVISLLSHMDHDNFSRVLEDRSLIVQKLPCPSFARVAFSMPQRGPRPSGGRRFGGRPGHRMHSGQGHRSQSHSSGGHHRTGQSGYSHSYSGQSRQGSHNRHSGGRTGGSSHSAAHSQHRSHSQGNNRGNPGHQGRPQHHQ